MGLFVFQAEDGIRDLVRSRGLGDVYKRQAPIEAGADQGHFHWHVVLQPELDWPSTLSPVVELCLLYTSDAADERSSVDLGGRRIIKKKTNLNRCHSTLTSINSTSAT